jgi:hypothetical protein
MNQSHANHLSNYHSVRPQDLS